MEKRTAKITFNKSGGSSVGGITHRVILPKKWLEDMNINIDNRIVVIGYDEDKKEVNIKSKN